MLQPPAASRSLLNSAVLSRFQPVALKARCTCFFCCLFLQLVLAGLPAAILHARSKSADHLQLRRPFAAVRCPFHLSAAICTRPQQMPVLGVCASPGCSSRTGCVCVCVCASPGFHPLGVCVCASQTICSSGALLQPYIALFACPQPFVHARRPFAALAPFSCSQLFISLFMVAQPFNSQGFDNHFCSLIASIFRCNPDSRHV